MSRGEEPETNHNETMKTIINITAIVYDGTKLSIPERTYFFIRPNCTKKPTFFGAERMIAKEIGVKQSDVSAVRVECMSYDVK